MFYLPSLLGASVAIAILWRQIFGADGLVNQLLFLTLGIIGPGWVTHPDYALWTLVVLAIWQFGSPMIIFLAGLRQIPQDLYEAAAMDGAGPVRQFFRITLPLLAPVIFFNLVFQTIEAFKAFTQAFIVSGGNGGPVDSTLFYSLYLYIEAFENFRMGYASALAWLLLVIIGVFTGDRIPHLALLGLLRGRGPLDGDRKRASQRTSLPELDHARTRILVLAALRHALSAALDDRQLVQAGQSHLQRARPDPDRLGFLELRQRLACAPGELHDLLHELLHHRGRWR